MRRLKRQRDDELTDREAYILGFAVRVQERSMLRMDGFGNWSLFRAHVMYRHGSECNPSGAEGIRLLRRGLVTLRIDPNSFNTSNGERWPHARAIITPKGRAALERYHGRA